MKVSAVEVADLFAVSLQTIKLWSREGFPREKVGRRVLFPLRDCIRWVRENRPIEAKGQDTLSEARRRRAFAQAELAEYESALQRGELIRRETVLGEFMGRHAFIRGGLLQLPRSLPKKLVGKEVWEMAGILKKSVYDLLNRFSRRGGILKK